MWLLPEEKLNANQICLLRIIEVNEHFRAE